MTDFDDLYEGEHLSAAEEERLRRVHDLLLRAGPPDELTPALARPPAPGLGEVVHLRRVRHGRGLAFAAAAAAAAAVFGGGYLAGHESSHQSHTVAAARIVRLHGGEATGVIRLSAADEAGNWTMLVTVRGLPRLASNRRYELWLTRNGK